MRTCLVSVLGVILTACLVEAGPFDAAPDKITWVAVSPDGKTLVTGSVRSGGVTLYNVADGKKVGSYEQLQVIPHPWLFSDDGRTLVMGTGGGLVVYDLSTNTGRHTLDTSMLAFSRDGRLVASRQQTKQFFQIELVTLDKPFDMKSHGAPVAFSAAPDKTFFKGDFSLSDDGKVVAGVAQPMPSVPGMETALVWDVASRKKLASIPVPSGCTIQLSPNGSTLVVHSGARTAEVTLFDVASGKKLGGLELAPRERFVSNPADQNYTRITPQIVWFTPDGKHVIGRVSPTPIGGLPPMGPQRKPARPGAPPAAIHVWDAATGKRVGDLASADGVMRLVFSVDGHTVSGVGKDAVKRWELPSGKVTASTPLPPTMKPGLGQNLSTDGSTLASVSPEGAVYVWTVGAGQPREVIVGGTPARTPEKQPQYKTIPPGSRLVSLGTKIFFRDASGKTTPAPDGDYKLDNGYIMHVRGGEKVKF